MHVYSRTQFNSKVQHTLIKNFTTIFKGFPPLIPIMLHSATSTMKKIVKLRKIIKPGKRIGNFTGLVTLTHTDTLNLLE